MSQSTEESINKEAVFGIVPVDRKGRVYGFFDAFLVLSGYCIATWSYTQGAYLISLVNFKQLLISSFFAAILMLAVYQLPVILSVRYGIDIWIWLKTVFGTRGIKVVSVIIILINFPWYAVCADLFASSMGNLFAMAGITLPGWGHTALSLLCVLAGTVIALKGIGAITWTTRILVPLLLAVGAAVVGVGLTAVPADVILDYKPDISAFPDKYIPYITSVEANFAFVITLVGGMAGVPRLTKTERAGFWAGVFGQGLSGSFFVVVGAVMAIAMHYVTGEYSVDPTLMLSLLAFPALGFLSLILVAFANIGTQAVGSYIYAVMLKSSFSKVKYRTFLIVLAVYVGLLCIWGKIIDYFGSFLTVSACIYAPLAALLCADFFIVRKQRIDLKSAFELKGHDSYRFTGGFNIVGMICLVAGAAISLLIYDPVGGVIHSRLLFNLTPTGCSFIGTGLLYVILCSIPAVRRYACKDIDNSDTSGLRWKNMSRPGITPELKPFDSKLTPPKQNLFFMPFIWAACFFLTRSGRLKIRKSGMKGLKPPFIVFASHQAFMDFYVTPLLLFPHRANYISELEGFEAFGEWIYRQAGCLGTRKFINDVPLVRNIQRVMKRNGILVIYPEARYANVGTSWKIPRSTGQLCRLLNVPVVTVNMKGNYLQSPIWNLRKRKDVRLDAEIKLLYTKEDVKNIPVDEMTDRILEEIRSDEYEYQRKAGIKIREPWRAEGLEKPLWICRACKTEFHMETKGSILKCGKCGRQWELDEDGLLQLKVEGEGSVPEDIKTVKIEDWYDWEREFVDKQAAAGKYELDTKVHIEALPNGKNFVNLGTGRLVHKQEGFYLTYRDYGEKEDKTEYFSSGSLFSIHTEYDYRGNGQCITLSTRDNTYFLFPEKEIREGKGAFNATRLQFATEYFHENHRA